MVTIKDIAREAGVSITTVSRALNNYDDVSTSTKELILKIAKERGYVPNLSAQNLVKQKNNTLAIILSGLEKEGGKDNIAYSLLSGMYTYAETVNYEVVLFTTSTAKQKQKTYVQFCREHNIGGAVLHGIRTDDPYFEEIISSDLPCVLIDIKTEGKNTSSISIDNIKASKEAVEYLISYNHRNIGMINGLQEAAVSVDRYEGYLDALIKHNIPLNPQYMVHADFAEEVSYVKTKELLISHPEITALFCASDMMALGSMKAIKDLKLKIPKNISIIGFDNIPLSQYFTPALTTVAQDFYLMGKESAKQLLKMITKEKCENCVYLSYKLVERKSVNMI